MRSAWGRVSSPCGSGCTGPVVPGTKRGQAASPSRAEGRSMSYSRRRRAFGGSAAIRGPLKVIFDAHAQDPGASDVPERALQAYRDLAGAIGFSAGKGAAGAPEDRKSTRLIS